LRCRSERIKTEKRMTKEQGLHLNSLQTAGRIPDAGKIPKELFKLADR
jgi:hypothetical protein